MNVNEYEELKKQILDRGVSLSSQVGSHFTNRLVIHLIDSIRKLNCSTTWLSIIMIILIVVQIILAIVRK